MFKISIALVGLAFVTLAYGWVRGIDPLLYGSIAFSALAGLALMRSTMQERRQHPELTKKGRKAVEERDRDRKSLAELRGELSGLKGEIGAGDEGLSPKRKPLRPFGDTAAGEEVEARRPVRERSVIPGDEEVPARRPARERSVIPGDEEVPVRRPARERGASLEQRVRRPESPRPSGPRDTGDFRSRLSAVLGEAAEAPEDVEAEVTPRPRPASRRPEPELEDDEIGSDWIRIDDLPRLSRPPRAQRSTEARSEPASPSKRRTTPATKSTKRPAAPKAPTTPRSPRGKSTKSAPGSEPPK